MKKHKKTIEIQLPHETVKELLISHLYAVSYLNDDQEVLDFKFKRGVDLKNVVAFDIVVTSKEDEPVLPGSPEA